MSHRFSVPIRLVLGLVAAGSSSARGGPEVIVHAGENANPDAGPAGVEPYEMAGRGEERAPLVDFSDASRWRVEGIQAEGWLHRSGQQRLYGRDASKLIYVARGDKPVVNVLLNEPIPIPEPWDVFTFWNYGNNWGWAPDPKTPALSVAVLLEDAAGERVSLWPGVIHYEYWFLMSSRFPAEVRARCRPPLRLLGFQFHNGTNTEKRAIWLGPCYAFQEPMGPLTFEPWPDRLPFPTRQETILPTNKTPDYTNDARMDGEAALFSYRGRDAELTYRYRPATGTLSDIALQFGGRVLFPCLGGGMQLAGPGGPVPPGDPRIQRTLKTGRLEGGRFTAVWRLACGERAADVTYTLQMRQKSLLVDIEASEPAVERVALGRAEPVREPKLFKVPYLTYAYGDPNVDPRVLYSEGLFLLTQFDWYRSDASKLVGGGEAQADWAVTNGGAQYLPKTDGRRNRVRERLFINASPDFQEVLPTIPNPPSPHRRTMGDRLWRVKSGADHAAEVAEARGYRGYGCEKVAVRYHEDSWRDGGESFTFRLEAARGRGGDAALAKMVERIRALGWLVGLYTNYTDFAPVNAFWSPDHVCREPNGQWQGAWMRCYSAKPMWAVEMEARLAPQIAAKFKPNHSYCDVHTAIPPWERNDYDARVPGAGTFRRTFECYGRIMLGEKAAYRGPVYSEGRNHWMYAGLTDGNYAQIISEAPHQEPLLVDFDLLKIHPLEMDAGMGAPGMFFRGGTPDLDQFIATTLAYGHIGYLEWSSLAGTLKIYHMLQPVQRGYVMEPVASIAYEHEGRMLDTSEALIRGAYRNNRVHVVYANGTNVTVNGSKEEWTVDVPPPVGRCTLPRWGWAVWTKEALSVSAMLPPEEPGGAARRFDLCTAPGRYYADSRGGFVALPNGISLQGSAVLARDGEAWTLTPTDQCREFALAPGLIGLDESAAVTGTALDAEGRLIGELEASRRAGRLHLRLSDKPAHHYRLRTGPSGSASRRSMP